MISRRPLQFRNSFTQIVTLVFILWFIISSMGCEAFIKKFTRKPKKEEPPEEMILVPEEYPSLFKDKEEAYRQYFLYWKSWQDELINSLSVGTSQKKQLSCADEALKNLNEIKKILVEEKHKALDLYITELIGLRDNIKNDPYSNNAANNRSLAEVLKRNILRDFSYPKVKDFLR